MSSNPGIGTVHFALAMVLWTGNRPRDRADVEEENGQAPNRRRT